MTQDVVEILDDKRVVTRERIFDLEAACREMPPVELPVRHFFANGLYGRELFVPAGVCAVGKIHRHEQLTVVCGDIDIVTPGEEPTRITGFHTFSTPAGIKRAVFAYEDTFITTFHTNPDNSQDLDKIERYLIAPSFDALEATTVEPLEVKA